MKLFGWVVLSNLLAYATVVFIELWREADGASKRW